MYYDNGTMEDVSAPTTSKFTWKWDPYMDAIVLYQMGDAALGLNIDSYGGYFSGSEVVDAYKTYLARLVLSE